MINLVVFASGSGTNFQAIIDAVENGEINGRIRGLITNKDGIQSIERAQNHGIPHVTIAPSDFNDRTNYTQILLQQLDDWDTNLIALAGYMLKIPAAVIQKYEGQIVNIHPSLLPKYGGKGFYGMNVHRAVIEKGESESGCTVHLVSEEYDEGPILAQRKVPVYKVDDASSLAERVLKEEHNLFPKVIAELADQINNKSFN